MEGERGIDSHDIGTKKEKPPRPIRTSKELTDSLGYTRDPNEPPTNFYRTYRKDFFSFFANARIHTELAFQDVDRGGKARRERILLDVCVVDGESGWEGRSGGELVDLAREELEPLLVFDPVTERIEKDFEKRILREVKDGKSGYDRIKEVIERIESRGYLGGQAMDLRAALSSEYNFGTELSRYLIEQFQEYFPEYPYFLDRYKKEKKVYFYGEREKGKKTVRVVRLGVDRDSLEIQSRRASIQPDPEDPKKFFLTKFPESAFLKDIIS